MFPTNGERRSWLSENDNFTDFSGSKMRNQKISFYSLKLEFHLSKYKKKKKKNPQRSKPSHDRCFHVGRLSKLPSTSFPQMCCTYKGKVLSTCLCFVDGIKMNPPWHNDFKNSTENSELHKLQPSPVPQPFSQSRQHTLRKDKTTED